MLTHFDNSLRTLLSLYILLNYIKYLTICSLKTPGFTHFPLHLKELQHLQTRLTNSYMMSSYPKCGNASVMCPECQFGHRLRNKEAFLSLPSVLIHSPMLLVLVNIFLLYPNNWSHLLRELTMKSMMKRSSLQQNGCSR